MGVYRSFSLESAEQEKKDLIDAGWYKENEIKVIHYPPLHPDGFEQYVLEVNRKEIKNEYSKIPFNLMAKYVKESGLTFKGEVLQENVPDTLSVIDKEINDYVDKKGNKSRAEDWIGNQKPWQKDLRHDYLHFSARLEFAHLPRFESFQRHRKVYRG